MKAFQFKKLSNSLKGQAAKLSEQGFKQIFDHIDQLKIRKGVDTMGLDKFIDQCAYLAAGSGVISGSGGMITMVIGMPVDMANLITQQFRVTMAIMYANQGSYHFGFDEFMRMVATSLKVEAGIALSKTMMESVAEKLLLMFGTRTAERLVPVVGGLIGGATNYLFIKRVAEKVKESHMGQTSLAI
ncbi:hypothetical protein HQ865_20200 [Mucilaginibacter mali]|uniref:EcsC family protein n=1 Tax=Mucilaginibacter mali TaxID=2740462 RepID=A0A7D4Q5W2_9SPHI|nr:hypothetical protein [Mucilaginibacter mali]QKJ31987.1 hypothetical protein HQ865_20200 [Mucilaginibacter mali]